MKTKHHSKRLAGMLLAAFVLPLAVHAQQMNYQGRLTDSSGDPLLDGQFSLSFNMYTEAGVLVWGPFQTDGASGDGHAAQADLVNGRFNVVLGPNDTGGDPISDAFLTIAGVSGARYLGITVESDPEISPRQQILAAPTALHAVEADHASVADGFISAVLFRDEGQLFVGVGTEVPNSKLHVNGDGIVPSLRVQVNGSSKLIVDPNGGTAIGSNTTPPANGLFVNGSVGIGTIPTEKLDVAGNIKATGNVTANTIAANTITASSIAAAGDVTAANGKSVAVGEERLRIVRGVIRSDGVIFGGGGTGFTVTKGATGFYTINFSPSFSNFPAVTVTATATVAVIPNLPILNGNEVMVRLHIPTVADVDANFSFIAIGPR